MTESQVETGQVWRRKRDGKLLTIRRPGPYSGEWRWADDNGNGGVVFETTLLDGRYELVSDGRLG